MKVKRIIKAFIYLFPVLACISNMIMLSIPPVRFTSLENTLGSAWDSEVREQYTHLFTGRDMLLSNFLSPILNDSAFINSDDTPLYQSYRQLLNQVGLVNEDTGSYLDFVSWFLTYETYAIIICAIIDVIFLIPEFYNKIEDKYIKGGKKRE